MEKKNVPEIRFKGFEGEYIQLKFEDIAKVSQGLQIAIEKRYLKQDKNNLFYITNEFLKKDSKIKYFIKDAPESVIANKDDILMTRTGNTGKVITDVHGAFHNNFFKINYDRNITSKYYLFYLLNSSIYQKIILSKAGSSTIPDLNHKDFLSISLKAPSLKEQIKVEELLHTIDRKLEVEKDKHKKLEDFKKSMLENMFPKEGENIPKLRFNGFDEKWKKKNLEEIADRYDNLRIPISESSRIAGSTPYYGANGIQDYVEGFTHEGEFVLVAEDGANDVTNYPVLFVSGRIWVNNHAHVIKGKTDICSTIFLKYLMKNTDVSKVLVGGSRAKLNSQAMMKLEVILPSLEEQEKIGTFFKNLDEKMEASEEKIKKIEEFKKSLMEKMFV